MIPKKISFKLNGKDVRVIAPPAYTLLEVLRDILDVTGPKEDCAKGECGACTVLIDERAVNSCLVLIAQVEGCDVVTSEGISDNNRLDPIQVAFVEQGAAQCGHCTPGMIVATKALLTRNPHATRDEIRLALSGNICRCTGYSKIIKAVETAQSHLHSREN
jgi:aerobic-type carbon monoxide dehydrogenase small subunit (CoxS/CutS family)